MARERGELWTAWASVTGRIGFTCGVTFPAGTLPVCCGRIEDLRRNFQPLKRIWKFSCRSIAEAKNDQDRFEALERLRVQMSGRDGLMSYFSGMNRRDGL